RRRGRSNAPRLPAVRCPLDGAATRDPLRPTACTRRPTRDVRRRCVHVRLRRPSMSSIYPWWLACPPMESSARPSRGPAAQPPASTPHGCLQNSVCENEKDSDDPDDERDQNATHGEANPSLIWDTGGEQHRHQGAVRRCEQLGEAGTHLIREHGRL